jgi:isopentenyl-diphosphate delta-isomerase
MKIPIVDEQDEVIAYKTREETTREDIRRIVALHVFNKNGDVLIAKRQSTKIIDPNLWGPSVAGTVDEGFDYDETVLKEAEEEIGLDDIKPIFLKKMFYETENARRFTGVYYVIINEVERDLKRQEEEVSELKWVNVLELEKWWNEKPEEFVPSFKRSMDIIKEVYEEKFSTQS